jgi:hypothetical protein
VGALKLPIVRDTMEGHRRTCYSLKRLRMLPRNDEMLGEKKEEQEREKRIRGSEESK